MPEVHALPANVTVFERGWLSSNNILIHPASGEDGAMLVDSSHVNHVPQTVQLLRHALGDVPLARIVNTHLHSDHCGGNATLQGQFGAPVSVPHRSAAAVSAWDEDRLSYRATGQTCPPFALAGSFAPGDTLRAGGLDWQVLEAPGHDPDSVMLFEPAHGLLISADALWESGFGLVFPEISGEAGFGDVGRVLDSIERLPVRWVVPGHGAPFSDLAGALGRARSRLAAWQAAPERHARHALKVLVKYHLMEVRAEPIEQLVAWAEATPLLIGLRRHFPQAFGSDWGERAVQELTAAGALTMQDGIVRDA